MTSLKASLKSCVCLRMRDSCNRKVVMTRWRFVYQTIPVLDTLMFVLNMLPNHSTHAWLKHMKFIRWCANGHMQYCNMCIVFHYILCTCVQMMYPCSSTAWYLYTLSAVLLCILMVEVPYACICLTIWKCVGKYSHIGIDGWWDDGLSSSLSDFLCLVSRRSRLLSDWPCGHIASGISWPQPWCICIVLVCSWCF